MYTIYPVPTRRTKQRKKRPAAPTIPPSTPPSPRAFYSQAQNLTKQPKKSNSQATNLLTEYWTSPPPILPPPPPPKYLAGTFTHYFSSYIHSSLSSASPILNFSSSSPTHLYHHPPPPPPYTRTFPRFCVHRSCSLGFFFLLRIENPIQPRSGLLCCCAPLHSNYISLRRSVTRPASTFISARNVFPFLFRRLLYE